MTKPAGLKAVDLSMSERQEAVTAALRARLGGDLYVVELYDERAVYQTYGEGENAGKTFEVEYSLDDAGAATLGEDATEVKRRTTYQAVKFSEDDEDGSLIEGLAIPFAAKGKDLDGEYFGSDTDLCLDWYPEGRPILFHHGLDGTIKTDVVGRQTSAEVLDEEGLWVKAQLDKRSRWYERVKKLVDAKSVGFSSGAMAHLVKTTKSGHITRWPWTELTLTPTNAHPGAVAYGVKTATLFSQDDGSGSESFDAHTARIASEVGTFLERAQKRLDLRAAKVGRELSPSNREALESLYAGMTPVEDLRRSVKELLARTDPQATKDMLALETELLVSDLRRSGVPV